MPVKPKGSVDPTSAGREPITTQRAQRAYTLRLRPAIDDGDSPAQVSGKREELSNALWATHEAVNRGAKFFGDWLLTLRGGLDHTLAEPPPDPKRSPADTKQMRRERRALLALGWLSVEDEGGAPIGAARVASGREPTEQRCAKVLSALRSILASRRVADAEIREWEEDCSPSLSARIRDDAVWVNRSRRFDERCSDLCGLHREYARDLTFMFFGPIEKYFALPTTGGDGDSKAFPSDGPKFRTIARQWISTNFGTRKKSDEGHIAKSLREIAAADLTGFADQPKQEFLTYLAQRLGATSANEGAIRRAVGWLTGRHSKGRLALKALPARVSLTDLEGLKRKFGQEAAEKENRAATRTIPAWMSAHREECESAVGLPFVVQRDLTGKYSVMLDHAARRVSIAHSWIKRAEAQRRRFADEAELAREVPSDARTWLDQYCRERSKTSGSIDGYRIRRRAIEGWDDVVRAWGRTASASAQDRVAAARELQPDSEKFGDIQLFEALAVDEARCVWQPAGRIDAGPLKDFVKATEALANQKRFKVPAYRHPDPLSHPVFTDFGNSRWEIRFAIQEPPGKPRNKKRMGAPPSWIQHRHSLTLGLWDRAAVADVALRWSSKRLIEDLALQAPSRSDSQAFVTRATRLGRAASGASSDKSPRVAGLFEQDHWNGRLQAPRDQLDAIHRRVVKDGKGWDEKALEMRRELDWLITFSAALECRGPFIDYAARNGITANRRGEYYPHGVRNKEEQRQGQARLVLSRLPDLRVLSVDLGHRFAAACAVWRAVSAEQLKRDLSEAAERGSRFERPAGDEWLHIVETEDRTMGGESKQVERRTIYRRIGNDQIVDRSTGEEQPHPAPWARLERQFLIKLQGEEKPARAASMAETADVVDLEKSVGRVRSIEEPLPRPVDDLMSEAVRSVRLALRRHGDVARIAYAFHPDSKSQRPGGVASAHTVESRAEAILDALVRWHAIATDTRWVDKSATAEWTRQVLPHVDTALPRLPDGADRSERKRHRAKVEAVLRPIAQRLGSEGAKSLHEFWQRHWTEEEASWRPRLRWLRRWLLPRGLRRVRSDTDNERRARNLRRLSAREVGGLSLTRIATLKGLYQVQKAFAMRPEPQDPRKNVPGPDDDRLRNFGRSILDAMERLRDQRVKQLASRIVEAALGVGRMKRSGTRDIARPTVHVDPPCHAVVIESLRNYRPDELQTRRENRALMDWSAGKVRESLKESCQLHGLYLCEVQANYTSQQCSRTGMPGVRCDDVSTDDFMTRSWWRSAVSAATKRVESGSDDAESKLLADLGRSLARIRSEQKPAPAFVRLPRKGGDLFVAAIPPSCRSSGHRTCALCRPGRAVQADLNAAANIGLRALLDPDWAGRWWFIPCGARDGKPAKDKVAGSECIDLNARFFEPSAKGMDKKDFVNVWRDVTSDAPHPAHGQWDRWGEYWNRVRWRVVDALRRFNATKLGGDLSA